jgi:hypothetical protein
MYQLPKVLEGWAIQSVIRTNEDGKQCSIPFDPQNTDFANFKKEVLAGAELQDADGNVMTDASAFIATLP